MNAIETLQKLINHEKRAREVGSVHEAAAAAGRIQALLTQHKLTMDDRKIGGTDDRIGWTNVHIVTGVWPREGRVVIGFTDGPIT